MSGRFIAIVGASGVGKDSVMRALAARSPQFVLARRMITRPPDAGGEDFDGVSAEDFATHQKCGAFALHWQAHGLSYAIPNSVDDHLADGHDVLANLSRSILPLAKARFARFDVVFITANRDALVARLHARGRENAAEIARRLDRAEHALPVGIAHQTFDNSGPLANTVNAIMAHLHPVKA